MHPKKTNRQSGFKVVSLIILVLILAGGIAYSVYNSATSEDKLDLTTPEGKARYIIAKAKKIADKIDHVQKKQKDTRLVILAERDPDCDRDYALCLYDPDEKIMPAPYFPANILTSEPYFTGASSHHDGGIAFKGSHDFDFGTAIEEDAIVIKGIDAEVCKYINHVLHKESLNSIASKPNPYVVKVANIDPSERNAVGSVQLYENSSHADKYREGCYFVDLFGEYVYFKITTVR